MKFDSLNGTSLLLGALLACAAVLIGYRIYHGYGSSSKFQELHMFYTDVLGKKNRFNSELKFNSVSDNIYTTCATLIISSLRRSNTRKVYQHAD